jgi:hypothetical protein
MLHFAMKSSRCHPFTNSQPVRRTSITNPGAPTQGTIEKDYSSAMVFQPKRAIASII